MRTRTWPFLMIAFGTLLILIAMSGLAALRQTRQIYGEIFALHDNYQRSQRTLNDVRTEVHLSGVLVRDYLLDPSHLAAAHYREQLLAIRASMTRELEDLKSMISGEDAAKLSRLDQELDKYWESLEPLFEWTPRQKIHLSSLFLRQQVLPRRNAVLALARELRDLNQAALERQRREINRKQSELPVFMRRMLALTLVLGLLVAGGSIYRISRLERESEKEWRRAERAEQELRRLSQQLVQAQEEERRVISRELHDEVGQMLTALRFGLRNLEESRSVSEDQFRNHLDDARALAERALRAVRDLAMGLRPSMLDDLGLGPAVEWQAREFSRRFGVPVTVQLDGALDALPDAHRTCIYRVMQEALTNCARHARATEIRVAIQGHQDGLSLTIQDDGVGFDATESRARGLGLLGIHERVRELDGKVTIVSQPERGTVLAVELPLPQTEYHQAAASR